MFKVLFPEIRTGCHIACYFLGRFYLGWPVKFIYFAATFRILYTKRFACSSFLSILPVIIDVSTICVTRFGHVSLKFFFLISRRHWIFLFTRQLNVQVFVTKN